MNQAPVQHRVRQVAGNPRSTGIAYLIFFLTAMIGFHMFYFRRPGLAVAKILTINFIGIGMLIDLFMMPTYVRGANGA